MTRAFTVIDQGVIYRTDTGLQGYYPRVVRLGANELLASLVASTTIEGPDSHPILTRSLDGGKTWTVEGPVDPDWRPGVLYTDTGFLSAGEGGMLFCQGGHWVLDPADPDAPLVHGETLGMRDNEVLLRRSHDGGRTWSAPVTLPKPYPTPLEAPTGMVQLADGTLIFSSSTWRFWDGSCPYGHRISTLRSSDDGATWSEPIDIFHDPTGRLGFWEGRIAQLTTDTLVATCWAHDWETEEDSFNHYAISRDAGRSWNSAAPSPVRGQTGWPMRLADDRFLFVYNHRRPPVGVRAQVVQLVDGRWETLFDDELWTPEDRRVGEIVKGDYAVTGFQFGAPSAIPIGDGTFLAIYWCVVGGRAGINWTLGRLEE